MEKDDDESGTFHEDPPSSITEAKPPADDRIEDVHEGDGCAAAAAGDGDKSDQKKRISSQQRPQRKAMSYSQPLGCDAVPGCAARRSSHRNHSLDDDRLFPDLSDGGAAGGAEPAGYHSYSNPYLAPSRPPHHHAYGSLPVLPFSANKYWRPPSSGSDGSLTLEQALSEYGGALGTLPEFTGSGGGAGIFKVPLRAAVHPGRPPSLELRPHPLRETQAGSVLRAIVCAGNQLWAGQDSGVRYWNVAEVFEEWGGPRFPVRPKPGDEGAAPFRESHKTSAAACLVADVANGLVWSGHRDGKIRSWRIAPHNGAREGEGLDLAPFSEGLSWQAHRSPVLSIVISSYGDLWSGSCGGVIKVWPWESIEKSLCLAPKERHIAASLVERSYIDLRNRVTVNGVCNLSAADVKFLVADNSRLRVWSGGHLSFALWDSRTKELLKVFGLDGQVETRADVSSPQDTPVKDEAKVKFVSTSKKEKSQGSINFFQRSRNALMGAADAVRRVAVKGMFVDEYRRAEAFALSMDGMIWMGCTNGTLVQWDGNGNRLQDFLHHSSTVHCLRPFGALIWVGYLSGTVQVIDLEGNLIAGWIAHYGPVIGMDVGGPYVFTLAGHGGIRGWNRASLGPVDSILRTEISSKELLYTRLENIKVLVGTWNVGQGRASPDSLLSWLGCAATDAGLVVVGLQEVEMGAGFLAMAAAKESVGMEGSSNGNWWLSNIGKTLDEGSSFERVGSRQLAGLLIAAWARKNLAPHVGDVDAAAVPCGFGRAIGNKGAVGLRMRVYDRILCFVSCHFAAHLEAVDRRNIDFSHVYRTMTFTRQNGALNSISAGASSANQVQRGVNATGLHADDGKPELSEADMVVFLGDFNYRLHSITYDEARDFVSQRCFDWLREKDQLRAEMKAGNVFQGMREAHIKFPPTYKFERHQAGLSGYDSSEKKRIPAWCDRILYRDSRSISVAECSLECPVVSCISQYDACMDVTDSDHKPVRCMYCVEIAHVDEFIRRKQFGEAISTNEKVKCLLNEPCGAPETIVSSNNIILQNKDTAVMRITNKCEEDVAIYQIICEGQSTIMEDGQASELFPRGSFGFPQWLEVLPAAGTIKPGRIAEVSIRHEEFYTQEEFVDGIPQNWWCEDIRNREVVLLVNVGGGGGGGSAIRTQHRIKVRHCFSSGAPCRDEKADPRKSEPNFLQRSDFAAPSCDPEPINDLWSTQFQQE